MGKIKTKKGEKPPPLSPKELQRGKIKERKREDITNRKWELGEPLRVNGKSGNKRRERSREIIEEKDCSPTQRDIKSVNGGVYA